jgi:hypothetical protein
LMPPFIKMNKLVRNGSVEKLRRHGCWPCKLWDGWYLSCDVSLQENIPIWTSGKRQGRFIYKYGLQATDDQ